MVKTNIDKGIFDEFGCFNIIDFQCGDNIMVMVRDPANRHRKIGIKGIVVSTTNRPPTITYTDKSGDTHTARLNDITFLQAPEQGWINR